MCLQKFWRGHMARKELRRLRGEQAMLREKAAITIQKNWKMTLESRKYKRIYEATIL